MSALQIGLILAALAVALSAIYLGVWLMDRSEAKRKRQQWNADCLARLRGITNGQ